jgi:carbon storage regulator CsrA
MLILSRKENEGIVINVGGTLVAIDVLSVRGDRIRLGFHADDHVKIHRRELLAAILNNPNGKPGARSNGEEISDHHQTRNGIQ